MWGVREAYNTICFVSLVSTSTTVSLDVKDTRPEAFGSTLVDAGRTGS